MLSHFDNICHPQLSALCRFAFANKFALPQIVTLNAQLSELSDEQAAYIGVPKSGPYKLDTYRY